MPRFLSGNEAQLAGQTGFQSVILAVWEAPGRHLGCLGGSWVTFCLSGRVLGNILAVWESRGRHFACLGSSWEAFWLSGKLLGIILAVWELHGSHFTYLRSSWESFWLSGKLLGIIFGSLERFQESFLSIWKAPERVLKNFRYLGSFWNWAAHGSHFGCLRRNFLIVISAT